MASYNKIILAGNIGKDCETRDVNDVKVMSFTLAVSQRWTDKDGNPQEKTDWFTVDYFSKTDKIAEYLKKGQSVLVEGQMSSHEYEKDGQKRTFWGLTVENVEFCGNKGDQSSAPAPATAPADQAAGFTAVETDELPF